MHRIQGQTNIITNTHTQASAHKQTQTHTHTRACVRAQTNAYIQ